MKLKAQTYVSPIVTEGTFENVIIEETSFQVKRKENYFRIDFDMYLEDKPEVILCSSYLAFQGMDDDEVNSNIKATFRFNDDSEEEEPRGLISYLENNAGVYPEDYTMINWGFPTFEQLSQFLNGGDPFGTPEINPVNEFVKQWVLNTVSMKGEKIGEQFEFVE